MPTIVPCGFGKAISTCCNAAYFAWHSLVGPRTLPFHATVPQLDMATSTVTGTSPVDTEPHEQWYESFGFTYRNDELFGVTYEYHEEKVEALQNELDALRQAHAKDLSNWSIKHKILQRSYEGVQAQITQKDICIGDLRNDIDARAAEVRVLDRQTQSIEEQVHAMEEHLQAKEEAFAIISAEKQFIVCKAANTKAILNQRCKDLIAERDALALNNRELDFMFANKEQQHSNHLHHELDIARELADSSSSRLAAYINNASALRSDNIQLRHYNSTINDDLGQAHQANEHLIQQVHAADAGKARDLFALHRAERQRSISIHGTELVDYDCNNC
ncbi:hypothetical protein B0J12DRAFT_743978 [Macrophomina phaseolina]|uniref:Uncharacterized protein n=1 Tax=Macrophomina phaseolina TaxID=35725 RepID=A0ABQ8FZU7_9PEZI|nr:hypothetical protein B0J12DRAFT_743978 [Macrophomina phaseolina]